MYEDISDQTMFLFFFWQYLEGRVANIMPIFTVNYNFYLAVKIYRTWLYCIAHTFYTVFTIFTKNIRKFTDSYILELTLWKDQLCQISDMLVYKCPFSHSHTFYFDGLIIFKFSIFGNQVCRAAVTFMYFIFSRSHLLALNSVFLRVVIWKSLYNYSV